MMPHLYRSPPNDLLPLSLGQRGEAIRDLQSRLIRAGSSEINDPSGHFGQSTLAAVEAFQATAGLDVDGICGRQTWAALVEAGYGLGDRHLYQRSPMLRGDDIAELQTRLSALGFHSGRVDGIFGPETSAAVMNFQENAGLTTDGVVGPSVLDHLIRLGGRTGTVTKALLSEQLTLQDAPRHLNGQRIVIAQTGSLPAIAGAVSRKLDDAGALTLVVNHPDGSTQADEANRFQATLFLSLTGRVEPGSSLAYYKTSGFESIGGRRFAALAREALQTTALPGAVEIKGMRVDTLRETVMPAVTCSIGPVVWLVEHAAAVSEAITDAVARWTAEPLDDD